MLRPVGWKPSEEQKRHLLSFEGYGVDHPDIIFIGLEEYCYTDHERQRDGIWIRCSDPVFADRRADKNEVHKILDPERKFETVRVWKVMAEIVSRLTGSSAAIELRALGTRPAQSRLSTWLTELHPLPRPGKNRYTETYIADWFEFAKKQAYESHAKALSGPRILAQLRHHSPPKYAFCYGKDACDWARKTLAPELVAPFEREGAGIEIGKTSHGTLVVLTGFYSGQHGSSAFRIGQVSDLIKRIEQHN